MKKRNISEEKFFKNNLLPLPLTLPSRILRCKSQAKSHFKRLEKREDPKCKNRNKNQEGSGRKQTEKCKHIGQSGRGEDRAKNSHRDS